MGKVDHFTKALQTGTQLRRGEEAAASMLSRAREAELALEEIRPRFHEPTRPIDPSHVVELAESIAALGLIEPLAVDRARRLVAGGHRWVALRLLAVASDQRPRVWSELVTGEALSTVFERLEILPVVTGAVAVHVLAFDSAEDALMARSIEIAENEKRRNYSAAQVRHMAATLRSAGFRDGVGRPRAGERALIPALSAVLGRSQRTVLRLLIEDEAPEKVTSVTISPACEDRRLHLALTRWLEHRGAPMNGTPTKSCAEKLLGLLT